MRGKCKRFLRMSSFLLRGDIGIRSFRTGLRSDVIAVCRKQGGMVFCQAEIADVYFGGHRG